MQSGGGGAASTSAPPRLAGLGDVEEFPWVEGEGERLMSLEMHGHLCDLVRRGNAAFRANRLDEAINCYSRANNIKPGDPIILSNRCLAYIKFSEFLKTRPPSVSEIHPISGLDPTTHAGLAGKDAEKVISLRPNSMTSYILKANALILLEKYELARDVVFSGLQIDPSSSPLLNLERSTAGMIRQRKSERNDDFDCTVCMKLFYEPVTTPCGHTFCRSCLFQTMDRSNKCPLCRTVLFISPSTCSVNVVLKSIIEKNFPEEYADRMSENQTLTLNGVDLLPLFVMDVTLPCQKFQLNIFEPRYRLMVRRIMEGNHRMGMVVIDSATGTIADYGCEVEITDCEPLPDGRFFLEVESRRRCRIIRNWGQDGYRVAEVEWVQDVLPEGTAESNDLQVMVNHAAQYAKNWMRAAQEVAQGDRIRLAELLKIERLMPTTQDPERFSFWLATLTNRRPSERLDLLRTRDTKQRLMRVLLYMKTEEYKHRIP